MTQGLDFLRKFSQAYCLVIIKNILVDLGSSTVVVSSIIAYYSFFISGGR